MKQSVKVTLSIDRFLTKAELLTSEQWLEVYWRYVHAPRILTAIRKFSTVAGQAILNQAMKRPIEEMGKRDPAVMAGNARIDRIIAKLPETEPDSQLGGRLQKRVSWLIVQTRLALDYAELLNADPRCRKAVRKFLTLYDGLITFPEYE